jgi:hypothetical protein
LVRNRFERIRSANRHRQTIFRRFDARVHFVKGSMTRRIGRFDKDSSPIKTESKFCPARIPAKSRTVVPLLPQSKFFQRF